MIVDAGRSFSWIIREFYSRFVNLKDLAEKFIQIVGLVRHLSVVIVEVVVVVACIVSFSDHSFITRILAQFLYNVLAPVVVHHDNKSGYRPNTRPTRFHFLPFFNVATELIMILFLHIVARRRAALVLL